MEEQFPTHRMFNADNSGVSAVPNYILKVILPEEKRLLAKVVSAKCPSS
jgi:hypothetical protein